MVALHICVGAETRQRQRDGEIVMKTFLARKTVLNEAKKEKQRASAERRGVFDAGRIIGPNKL